MGGIQTVELSNDLRLHTLETNKFKTTTLSVYIHNNIGQDAAFNALLPMVLKSGSKRFETPTIINEHLEHMYGAVFEADIVKKRGYTF